MSGLFDYKQEAVRYDRLKNSEGVQTSKIFAIESMVFSAVSFVIVLVMRFFINWFGGTLSGLGGGTSVTTSLTDVLYPLIFLLFGGAALSQYFSAGLKCYYQFILNDHVIKWIALGVDCALFIAGVVIFIITAVG